MTDQMTDPDNNIIKDQQHVTDVCKLGAGAECCRYLAMGGPGFQCLHDHPTLRFVVDRRVDTGNLTAVAINCDGWGSADD